MRLKQLIIDAFGRFSGKVFDFGAPREGCDFHIIYGHNEAGKTTLMAAYLRLLYGIPKNEPYASFHNGRKNLKISAVLEENGKTRFISRAPQGNSSVLTDKDRKIIAQAELETCLRGTNLQQYKNLLCLDDETIEAGGNEILKAEGDMGALLFSAGSGMSDFSAKLQALELKTDEELYKPRSQKTKFAQLKRRYQQLEEEISAKDILPRDYEELRDNAISLDGEAARAAQARRAAADIYEQLKALAAAQAETDEYQKNLRAVCAELARLRTELGLEIIAPRADASESYQILADFALTEAQLEQLDVLRAQAQEAQQKYNAAEGDIVDLRAKAGTAKQKISEFAALPAPETVSALGALLSECEEHNMPAALQTAKAQADNEAKRYDTALAALNAGGQIFAAPPHNPPRAAEIESLARTWEKQADNLAQLKNKLRDNEAKLQIITQKTAQAQRNLRGEAA